jgi:DNA/RNA endonuclease YhcR with UshA esterase domain
MKTKLVLSVAAMMISAALPMLAHHSFAAEYDSNKKLTLTGTVVKVDWMNPHIWVYIDSKDEKGTMVHWQCEGGPPNTLSRNGWTKDALKPGDTVTVEGFAAKDGSNTLNSRSVVLPDGRKVFAGTADDGAPKTQAEK